MLVYTVLLLYSLLTQSASLFWYWLLPLVCGQPVLWGSFIAQHTGCAVRATGDESSHDHRGLHSRTTMTNPVYRLLSWNMCYHGVHHMHPRIPFHRLPEAHNVLQAHAPGTRFTDPHGYLHVHLGLLRKLLSRQPKAP